ncbi:MAG TPA: fumarylacetoacetate hydrolase family protein [Lichenihabitans sp.]|nr:fumarylacetoacetate hydrolase family protein [Lichenihabitans sp.]
MLALIKAGPEALREVARLAEHHSGDRSLWLPLGELEFLSPVPVPEQIRDASMFPQHIRNAAAGMRRIRTARAGRSATDDEAGSRPDVPEAFRRQPIFYFQNRFNVVGHDATVTWPAASEVMDFELEFGVFIGRDGRDIPRERAREHVFGYAIYNDFSARDVQADEMEAGFGPAKAKSFAGANAIGPWIVTSDDIPDPAALEASVSVNGELWGRSDSAGMLHDLDSIIAYLSRDEMLKAGEFIGLGTMGQGCGLELGRYLQHGDVVELYVERIGRLRNRVLRGGA